MGSEITKYFKDLCEAAREYFEFRKLYDQHKEVPQSVKKIIQEYLKKVIPDFLKTEAEKCEILYSTFHNGVDAGGVRITIKMPFKREEVAGDFVNLLADFKVKVKSDLAEKFSVSDECFLTETLLKPKFDYD